MDNIHSRITLRVHLAMHGTMHGIVMEPAAFQLSYLYGGSVIHIKRNERLNKETKGSGLSCQSQFCKMSFCSSSDRHFHVPQVANQKFHGTADNFPVWYVVSSFTVSRGGARSQVRQGRDSIASAVVTSQKQTPWPSPVTLD